MAYEQSAPIPPPPPAPPNKAPRNGTAIAGLVLAIIGAITCWIPFLGIVLCFLAIIFSGIGLSRAKKRYGHNRGLAIAGLVVSIPMLIVSIILTAAFFVVVDTVNELVNVEQDFDEGTVGTLNNPLPVGHTSQGKHWELAITDAYITNSQAIITIRAENISDQAQEIGPFFADIDVELLVGDELLGSDFDIFATDSDPRGCGFEGNFLPGAVVTYDICFNLTRSQAANISNAVRVTHSDFLIITDRVYHTLP